MAHLGVNPSSARLYLSPTSPARPAFLDVYFYTTSNGIGNFHRIFRHGRTRMTSNANGDGSPEIRQLFQTVWDFAKSRTGKGVLKCSIAYFLGSLATFVPAIASMLGQQDGKHMVATITVYFHPARSQGSMFEAMILAVLAFVYAAFVGFTSMGISIFFGRVLDLVVVGHVIVLIVFCGGGLGFVGWIKQRLGHPLVNISCSLTSLAIITVLTKEGAVQAGTFSEDKIVQVLKMIVMGVIATTAVSFSIYPVSARADLREDMIAFTDSLSELLVRTTQTFLIGSEAELKTPEYRRATEKHKGLLANVEKNLVEAKHEHFVAGTEREYWLNAKLVGCMQRLAQNIGGLKNAAITQFLILAQPGLGSSAGIYPDTGANTPSTTHLEFPGALAVIEEATENEGNEPVTQDAAQEYENLVLTPNDVFAEFILHLGPSMKSLAYTLREILDNVPFGPGPQYQVTVDAQYLSSLQDAVKLYSQSRQDALSKIYDNNEVNKKRSIAVEADFEEIAASCGVFSYALLDFANDMTTYLDVLEDLKLEVEERPKGRTWDWLKFWRTSRSPVPRSGPVTYQDQDSDPLLTESSSATTQEAGTLAFDPSRIVKLEKNGQRETVRYRVWKAIAVFRRDDTRFAIKVGAGAALYALPSFLSSTRPIYQHFRGEWGLLSYMLVCSMTIGASNTTSYARFLGTCLGAICAILAWVLTEGNAFGLAAFGWFMSIWTAYVIVAQGKGPMGRFIMLTYNLSALYAYSLSVKDLDNDDDEGGISPIITEIAFHRVVAVLTGCLWGLIITRLIWPISAKQKLNDGLSTLWLRMGLIWKRMPLECRLRENTANAYMDEAEESYLHRFLSQLEKLRESAISEINLRAPFPDDSYKRLLSSTASMLDAFHAMNIMILKEPRLSAGEAAILRSTTSERAQLSLRIGHLFQGLHNQSHARKLAKGIKDISSELEGLFDVLNEDRLKLQ
ncbi:MAG: hypothetical protein Q9179_007321 [Wetmoreana sp. 5 TL-2023]